MKIQTTSNTCVTVGKQSLIQDLLKRKALYLMLVPGFVFLFIFCYGPMYGLIIAFKDYNIAIGIHESPWVGLKHFEAFFASGDSMRALKNTLVISVIKLVFGFPAPIILALLLNEIGTKWFKKLTQTVTYLPHFISWVVVSGMIMTIFSPSTGIVNQMIKMASGNSIYFMTDPKWFLVIIVVSSIWKEIGWSSVIYLAALSGVDAEQYEAAIVDGATRLQRIRYITLPAILPLASVVLVLAMGNIMNAGFDQIFNLYNDSVLKVADIIDTYVYRMGLVGMDYSFSAAVGFFKSVVALVLMVIVNTIVKKSNDNGAGLF